MPAFLVTPESYRVTEDELREAAVVLVFNPAGDAHVYVKTGVSPANVLDLVLNFSQRTVAEHFGAYTPSEPGPGTVIDG